MDDSIPIAGARPYPSWMAGLLHHPSLGEVAFRPLEAGDARILGRYFLGLGEDTRQRFGPHPFDQATADALCAQTGDAHTIRFIATAGQGAGEQAIAYFILGLSIGDVERERYYGVGIDLDPEADAAVAPSVADAVQDRGLGSLCMEHVIRVARRLGRRRLVLMGGVQATNWRAIHFYLKHGFRRMGTFEHPPGRSNHDMIVDL